MTEAKSAQNWNPGDCPMCGSNCAGGAHRNALAEDGVETSEQYQAMKNESAQPSPDSDGPCWKCGHPCECWFTDSRLWNKVNGGETGLLCLRCFIEIAETMGLKSCAWRLVPDALEGQNSGDEVRLPPLEEGLVDFPMRTTDDDLINQVAITILTQPEQSNDEGKEPKQ